MNSNPRTFLHLVLLALESLMVTGCGLKADYQHNEDKVENAIRR